MGQFACHPRQDADCPQNAGEEASAAPLRQGPRPRGTLRPSQSAPFRGRSSEAGSGVEPTRCPQANGSLRSRSRCHRDQPSIGQVRRPANGPGVRALPRDAAPQASCATPRKPSLRPHTGVLGRGAPIPRLRRSAKNSAVPSTLALAPAACRRPLLLSCNSRIAGTPRESLAVRLSPRCASLQMPILCQASTAPSLQARSRLALVLHPASIKLGVGHCNALRHLTSPRVAQAFFLRHLIRIIRRIDQSADKKVFPTVPEVHAVPA